MEEGDLLSQRGKRTRDFPSLMVEYLMTVFGKFYHPENNTQGIINFGVAENTLCEDLLTAKIRKMDMGEYCSEYQYYFPLSGITSFKEALANFIGKMFKTHDPVNPENLLVTSGVGAAFDHLAHMLCDPGDCCLIPTPYYEVLSSDIGIRAGVKSIYAPRNIKYENGKPTFQTDLEQTEIIIQSAIDKGQRVKMAIIINPDNPTGSILTQEEIMDLLKLFNKYKIHVVMDEIYGLSVLGDNTFTSVLSLDNLPCPEMVHFLWGFSKDFGLSGFRCGVIYTLMPKFAVDSDSILYFGAVPLIVQHILTNLITDKDWLEKTYFPENKRRMDAAFDYLTSELRELDITIYPSKAGFFIWANLSKYLPHPTQDEEKRLFEDLVAAGVYCVPGSALLCTEPGWFRLTFTHPKGYVDVGLERMVNVLRGRGYKKGGVMSTLGE